MDDFELLNDDHSLLSAQVVHVTALMKTLEHDPSWPSPLKTEVIRQVEILRQQLLEHFAFEEAQTFPRIDNRFPHASSRVEELREQHAKVMAALELVWNNLQSARAPHQVLADCEVFRVVFTDHATEENELLRQLANAAQ